MLDNINADDFLHDFDDEEDRRIGNSYDPFSYDEELDKVIF